MPFNSLTSTGFTVKTYLNHKKKEFRILFGLGFLCLLNAPFLLTTFLPSNIRNEEIISRFIYLKCPLFKFFEILCPTCGLGRSIVSLFLFEFDKSWTYHPGGIILYFKMISIISLYFFTPSIFEIFFSLLNNIKKSKFQKRLITFSFLSLYLLWHLQREPF